MFVIAALALLVAVGDVALGSCSGVLHLAPFALLLFPLLRGRYLCERYLSRAAAPRRPCTAAAAVVALARAGHDRVVRGSALVGSGLARRPPPRSA